MPNLSYLDSDFNHQLELICRPFAMDLDLMKKVQSILDDVQLRGDQAIFDFTKKWDHCVIDMDTMRVSLKDLDDAMSQITEQEQKLFEKISENIENYQKMNIPKSWTHRFDNGANLGKLVRPLNRVGIYVPGGTAPLISTVFMTVIPAKVAGVKEIVVATPPNSKGEIHPLILAACQFLGVHEVYRMGGAQAIAGMAYSTEIISKVDKIVGPGNAYIAMAKKLVYGVVDIDMIAGPSEILILADEKNKPDWVAADLLSQCEHDPMSRAYLVSTSADFLIEVEKQVQEQLKSLSRSSIAEKSWEKGGYLILAKDRTHAIEIANHIGPEHLEICYSNADQYINHIVNAGAIFMGEYTPEAVGDYVAGPSHVLPTGGSARFFSPLSVLSFLKETSILEYNRLTLEKERDIIEIMAECEGLDAHKRSISIRF